MAREKRRAGKKSGQGVPRGERTARVPRERRRHASSTIVTAAVLLVAVAAVLSYANSLSGEFFLDNAALIQDNPIVNKAEMAGKIFTSHYWAPKQASNLYRPLTILTYHLQYVTFETGDRPESYHVFNLVLHVSNALLALWVLLSLSRMLSVFADDRLNVLFAGFGAALFAAHPIATEAVTNIVGRADLLVMFFILLGFALHLRGGRARGAAAVWCHIGAALCMALALLSKENAIAMVAVLAAFDFLFLRPRDAAQGRGFVKWLLQRLKACYGFYALVVGGWFLARYLVLHDIPVPRASYVDNPLVYMSFLQREATAVVVLGLYLWRMLWPAVLSADYSAEQIPAVQSVADARLAGSLAAMVAIGIIGVLMWKRSRLVTFFILFFFIGIFPVSNLVVLTGTIGAERLLYVSSLGWAACLALGGVYLGKVLAGRWGNGATGVTCALLGVLVCLYGYRTHVRNNDWGDAVAFWRATVATSDHSARALQGYALALSRGADSDDLEESRRLLEKALNITERYIPVHATLGVVYMRMAERVERSGETELAKEYRRRAYDVLMRGREQDRIRQEEARRDLASFVRRGRNTVSGNWELYSTLGRTCLTILEMGEADDEEEMLKDAEASYRMAVLARPHKAASNVEYAYVLMQVAERRQEPERRRLLEAAAVSLWRAIIFDRAHTDAWTRLAQCYGRLGHEPEDLIKRRGGGFDFVHGDNENRHYLARAFCSLIMIQRAANPDEESERAVAIARGYGISRSLLESALTGTFSLDDPRIFTNES